MNTTKQQAFTFIEVLIVVAMLAILATIASVPYHISRQKARDTERISVLKDYKKALALYYQAKGHYPPACQSTTEELGEYENKKPPGCTDSFHDGFNWTVRWNNSYKPPFMSIIYPAYINRSDWFDPLGGNCGDSCADVDFAREWNCRYIIPKTSALDDNNSGGLGNNCPDESTYKEIQSYYLYCRLESTAMRESVGKNDEGWHDKLYELFEPNAWLCVTEDDDYPD